MDENFVWIPASLAEVETNVRATGYPGELLHFVKGRVEDTLPQWADRIGPIALLHLDTDWYASTKAELTFLWPSLEKDGSLFVDDFCHWSGSRNATVEFLGLTEAMKNDPFCFYLIKGRSPIY